VDKQIHWEQVMEGCLDLFERIAGGLERLVTVMETQVDSTARLPGPNITQASALGDTCDSTAITTSLGRIADALAPLPSEVVGTPYISQRLGCTTVWVAEMARKGEVPAGCLVSGTGKGKPWKFRREKVDQWLEHR
jgi:hypothetical protein